MAPIFALVVTWFGAPGPIELHAYSELVRLDPETGAWLESERAPVEPALLRLPLDPLRLEAARDEVLGFALVVSGSTVSNPVRWRPEAGPDGATSPLRLEVFEVRPIVVSEPSRGPFIHPLGAGAYPDVLVPAKALTPSGPRGIATAFIDVFVPRGAAVGAHRHRLEVGGQVVAIEVDVRSAILPAEDSAGIGAVSFGSFQARRIEDPTAFRTAMQLLYAHRFNVELIPPWRPREQEGGSGPDWEHWATEVSPYLDGTVFTEAHGYRGPRAGQPLKRFVLPVTEKWPSAPSAGRPSDPEAFRAALKAMEAALAGRGLLRPAGAPELVLFVNDLDEPKTAADFEALLSYEELLGALSRRSAFQFRVDGPFGARVPAWSDLEVAGRLSKLMDAVALCGAPPWIPGEAIERLRRERPERRLLLYASNTAGEPTLGPVVVDAPLSGLVAWGWIAARNDLSGVLNWELDFRPGCVRDPRCSGEAQNLDANLVFRAEELGGPPGDIYPSWRLKVLRRGAQDAALLALLEAKSPSRARAFEELVIPHPMEAGPAQGLGSWPKDPRSWERVRARLRAELDGELDRPRDESLRALEGGPRRRDSLGLVFVLTLVLLLVVAARRLARRPGI